MRVQFQIGDAANRLTLRMILEADGHVAVDAAPDVVVTDNPEAAVAWAHDTPTLVLAGFNEVAAAVRAMRQGVYGYILVPFQTGEAELMVRRAAAGRAGRTGHASAVPERPAPLAEVEARHIQQVLRHCKNNRAEAARVLGIGRNTLWRKMKQMEEMNLLG